MMKLAATILAVLALAAPASAQSGSSFIFAGPKGLHVLSQTSIPVRATGQLTVAFHGDPGTGCAARGLCAYSGTTSWRPVASGELAVVSYRLHGRRGYLASLFLGGGPGGGSVTVAEVRRAANPGQPGTCADASENDLGSSDLAVHGGTLALSLTDVTLLGTRCAGPRAPDLAQALPIRQTGDPRGPPWRDGRRLQRGSQLCRARLRRNGAIERSAEVRSTTVPTVKPATGRSAATVHAHSARDRELPSHPALWTSGRQASRREPTRRVRRP